MLKSPVFVTLCGALLINYLPATAHMGGFHASSGAGMSGRSTLAGYTRPGRPLRTFVDAYIKDNNEALAEVRNRSIQPFMIIDSVMDHYDLPEELRYLAVIESELRATAVSRVGAKGPWQLMAGTARELGLKVGRRADERTNYYRSTGAAALYLRDLHREFKDWLLVLAAYNAGPGPVCRAIRLAGSRNFWALERYLPRETRQHVRRFIATEYYFAVCGPVCDPVRQMDSPGAGAAGLTNAGVPGRMNVAIPGLAAAGLSDGASGDGCAGDVRAGDVRAGDVLARDVLAGDILAGDIRAEDVRAGYVRAGAGVVAEVAGTAWRRSEVFLL